MTIKQKIDKSLAVIRQNLVNAKSPIVMWSAGHDSQILLWLVRQLAEMPVFFFRESFQESKFQFANDMIAAWELDVRTALPMAVDLVGQQDTLEILNVIALDGQGRFLYLPTGINEAEPQFDWQCGCLLSKKETTDKIQWAWDVAFVGHKDCDEDPIQGAIPLPAEVVEGGPTRFVYPLKEWTDADIWEASRTYWIPQNFMRYDPFDNFKELADRSHNPDYMDVCTNCLKHDAADTAYCPKVEMEVPRVGNGVPYERRAEEWRRKFINVAT